MSEANNSGIASSDVEAVKKLGKARDNIITELRKSIVGMDDVIDELLISIFARGHALLEGVPGLAKTLLVSSLSECLSLSFKRIQFTPDLMPSDITGTEMLQDDPETGRRHFVFSKGPIFANFVLADEINRTPPKTQASLLEAMQEKMVSAGGNDFHLDLPFFVLATQNPLEQEGTYPLPEAQLDRFLLQIDVDYPDREAERRMLVATTGADETSIEAVMNGEQLLAIQKLIRHIPVGDSVVEAILTLVRNGRPEDSALPGIREQVAWGPGPRASQAMMLAVRARALLDGRLAPSVDDVLALARPVLRHRMALTFAARADGVTLAGVIDRLSEPLS